MMVYKFGGASIATPERMRALLPIVQDAPKELLVVVSAMGKTTNALEEIVKAACDDDKDGAHALAHNLETQHYEYAEDILSPESIVTAKQILATFFTELQWAIDDADANKYDYSYDQIVCIGELLSTRIFALFLAQEKLANTWLDARQIIRTDDTWRDARVDIEYTKAQAKAIILPALNTGLRVITQGFIGATDNNQSVTLGREGSDYTAALLASMLGADSVTIWKDVAGLRNADPKLFPDTVQIPDITYHEVIEMAYYGAQVIHPKTIKPLHNAGIPLYVKCFLDKKERGTIIHANDTQIAYPPIIVWKREQVLLQVTTLDFSFITEDALSFLYDTFARLKVRVNMIQNAAISFIACLDNNPEKIEAVIKALSVDYKVRRNEDVSLLTIRHFTPEILFGMIRNRTVLLEQKTRNTVQVVVM
ncbi:MAG: aspartate kinase [Chitinophagaceae bacterium]